MKMQKKNRLRYAAGLLAAAALWTAQPADCLAAPVIAAFPEGGRQETDAAGPGSGTDAAAGTKAETGTKTETGTDLISGFDVDRFVLPSEARVLVVEEGTGQSSCRVYAYERSESGWEKRLETEGYMGLNGMSNHRVSGDKTTPIGVFQMNTPFGQEDALEGFPSNYLKVTESHVWTDDTNVMVDDASAVG